MKTMVLLNSQIVLFSYLETMVLFSFTFVRKKPQADLLSATQLSLEPLPTVESLTQTLSFLSLIHTYLHTHTRTHHTTPQQRVFTQDFGDTVEKLYHSNTIVMLPTAGTKKAKAAPRQSKLQSAIALVGWDVQNVHISAYQYDRTLKSYDVPSADTEIVIYFYNRHLKCRHTGTSMHTHKTCFTEAVKWSHVVDIV